jgi:hypothetical protein
MLRNAIAEPLTIPANIVPQANFDRPAAQLSEKGEEDSAEYLFELLAGARRIAVAHRYRFLAYLIGMAAEEAKLLTQGRSASQS